MPIHAVAAGVETFTTSADTTVSQGHDNLLFNPPNALTSDQVQFNTGQVAVTAIPTVTLSDVTQAEGNSGTTDFVFTATLSSASAGAVTVNFATSDGTATTADNDYVATSGTLSFAAGVTSQLVTVMVNGDTTNEPDENFTVSLSGLTGDATLATNSSGIGTITNDDPVPTLTVSSPAPVNEGNSGTTPVVFTVTQSNPSSQASHGGL